MIELLKQIPTTAYVAVFTALITAGVTLLGVYLTNRANTQRLKLQQEHDRSLKRDEIYHERLEELYELFEEWLSDLFIHYHPYMGVMKGEISYNDALDQTIKQGEENPINFKRLQMLVDIYFPKVKPEFEVLLAERTKANHILDEHKCEYKKSNINGLKYLTPFLKAQNNINAQGLKVKEKIIEQVKRV